MKTLRIFISSPGDVAEERERARQVIDSLKRRYAGVFHLKPVLWEDLPLQADMSFQQGIDLVLSGEHGIDIAVFILWSRLGSQLGAMISKPDGTEYRSGTEREFDLMLRAREKSGGERPAFLVYTRRDEASFEERLRGRPTSEKEDLIQQKMLVERFISEEFHETGGGHNMRAYHSFDRPQTFSQRLRAHLVELLDAMAGGEAGEAVWDIETQGPPFMGLEAFGEKQAAVFCGREDEVLEARRALAANARDGCAFLLITGASGSGKSSLAKAGLLPAIREEELDETVAEWRPLVVTPSDLGADPVAGLVERLAAPGLLPELRAEGVEFGEVIASFRSGASSAMILLKQALAAAARKKSGGMRLLLLVDQLEEAFTRPGGEDLLVLMEALARSGVVWVVATVRGDFMGEVHRNPVLAGVLEARPVTSVLSPDADALRRMIEEPARLAGLRFERRGERCLSDKILADAARHADLLPLVEFVLLRLYERRDTEGLLSWDVYENELGGVEGALRRRADEVFDRLPGEVQDSLPQLLKRLVTLAEAGGGADDGTERFIRQRVGLGEFPPGSPQRRLIDALVEERLLTTTAAEGEQEGSVTVAHEALLRVWPRALAWAEGNRDLLRTRSRVTARMLEAERIAEGDPLLEAAKVHLAADPEAFTKAQKTFIEESVRGVEQRNQRRQKTRRTVMIGMAALTLVAVSGGLLALLQWKEADRQRVEAVTAGEQRSQTLARAQFERGVDQWLGGNRSRSAPLLAAALREQPDQPPYATMLASLLGPGRPLVSLPHPINMGGPLFAAAPDPAGRELVVSPLGTAALQIDLESGEVKSQWESAFSNVTRPTRSSDAKALAITDMQQIVYWSDFVSFDQEPDGGILIPMVFEHLTLTADGKHVLGVSGVANFFGIAGASGLFHWPVDSDEYETLEPGPEGEARTITGLIPAPQGSRVLILTREGTVTLFDAGAREVVRRWDFDQRPVAAAVSPDGNRIAIGFDQAVARLYDVTTGERVAALEFCGGSGFTARSLAFSADGRWIAAGLGGRGSRGGWAGVWESAGGLQVSPRLNHDDWVNSVAFDAEGERVLAVEDEGGFVLWDWRHAISLAKGSKEALAGAGGFATGKETFWTAGKDGWVRQWPDSSWSDASFPLPGGASVQLVEVSACGGYAATVTGGNRNVHQIWSLETLLPVHEPVWHEDGAVERIQFAGEREVLLVIFEDGSIESWDLDGGRLAASRATTAFEISMAGGGYFRPPAKSSIDVTPEGKPLVAELFLTPEAMEELAGQAMRDGVAEFANIQEKLSELLRGRLLLLDPVTLETTQELPSVTSPNLPAISPDGRVIVVTPNSGASALHVWRRENAQAAFGPEKIWSWTDEEQAGETAQIFWEKAVAPNGDRVVIQGIDGSLLVLTPITDKTLALHRIRGKFPAREMVLSPDGTKVAVRMDPDDYTGVVQVFDVVSGAPLNEALHHGDSINAMRFSDDGTLLFTASDDRSARIWDVASGLPAGVPLEHPDWVLDLAWDAAGGKLVTGARDGRLRVWPIPPAAPAPDWAAPAIEALWERRLDSDGVVRRLEPQRVHDLHQNLPQAGGWWAEAFGRLMNHEPPPIPSEQERSALEELERRFDLAWQAGRQQEALVVARQWLAHGGNPPEAGGDLSLLTALLTGREMAGNDYPVRMAGERLEAAPGLYLRWCPPGRYLIGSCVEDIHRYDDEPAHEVFLTNGFWMAETPVTQALWEEITGRSGLETARAALDLPGTRASGRDAPEQTRREELGLSADFDIADWDGFFGPDKPVVYVSWEDAAHFCELLTERERAAGRLPEGMEYRLPTEAEWEYACRAGTSESTYNGWLEIHDRLDAPTLEPIAWFAGNSHQEFSGGGLDATRWGMPEGSMAGPRRVGQKKPNAWGLHDMLGNVQEWCGDWFVPNYDLRFVGGEKINPVGPDRGAQRILRGGGWTHRPRVLRSSARFYFPPEWSDFKTGFRVVLAPGPTTKNAGQ